MTKSERKSRHNRRWFRFSLRAFLIAVTLIGIWLAWYVYRVERQKEVIRWVKNNGGEVYYDFERRPNPTSVFGIGQPKIPPRNPPGPSWLRQLLGVDYFATIEGVDLQDTDVKDVAMLRSLTKLKYLNLTYSQVQDLEPIKSLTRLTELNIACTRVTDLSPLSEMDNLRHLDLAGCLDLYNLRPIAKLTALKSLDMSQSAVNEQISKSNFASVAPLRGFESLTIYIDDFRVSESQIEQLRQALPNCTVEHGHYE